MDSYCEFKPCIVCTKLATLTLIEKYALCFECPYPLKNQYQKYEYRNKKMICNYCCKNITLNSKGHLIVYTNGICEKCYMSFAD
jgi:hypothetical protein